MRRLFNLSEEPENNIIKANSFFAWQLCSALFGAGCGDIALSWLKEHFSPMLKHRAGTLWETFDYYHSYAQSNGAALVMLFGKYLAGISPAGPGYSAISIDPYIPDDFYGRNNRDGMTSDGGYWSKGLKAGFRMPAGYIETAIRNDGGVIRYDITLPTGLKDSRLDVKSGIDLCVK